MTIVETATGRVRGVTTTGGVRVFKGIPYASAVRLAPPQPAASWPGVRDALEFGPQAPQVPGFLEQAFGLAAWPMSEDCLSLNVWAPPGGSRAPVLVWIHGGAFTNGTGAVPWYDGTAFAAHGCVLVTINYRLGALGFLHLADIDGERFAGSGNLGLLDQVAALGWVQRNIASFGGDPGNVTIFGESAGGASVASLLTCPAAAGRFHRAIAQSAAILQLRQREEATVAAERLLDTLGLGPRRLTDLFAVPVERLLAAQSAAFTGPDLFTAFAPTPDGTVLPEPVAKALAAGAGAGVPFVLGTNRDELYLFTALDGRAASLDAAGLAAVAERHAAGDAADLVAAYTAARPRATPGQLATSIAGDDAFWRPALDVATSRAAIGAPTWMYRFDWPTPTFGGLLGACHGVEIPFVFDTIGLPTAEIFLGDGPERAGIASAVHGAWARFATTGDPGWPRYDVERRLTMCFDTDSEVVADPDGELRRRWQR
ncbi:MAG TPA: carboxylesterase/lipase family protein [Acidimicrobiales bacterium]|nr:carboxylesterase/lipase family protein [Acidimicrobiales bacterium]